MCCIDCPGAQSRARTSDIRTTLLGQSVASIIGGRHSLAKLGADPDDGHWPLKVSSAKERLQAMLIDSRATTEPDHDRAVPIA